MRKLFVKLTALLLSLSLCFGLVGCKPQPTPPETVDGQALIRSAVAKLLDEEYLGITLNFATANYAWTDYDEYDEEPGTYKQNTTITAHLKNTLGVIDIIQEQTEVEIMDYANADLEDDEYTEIDGSYYIGNELVHWYKESNGDIVYSDIEQLPKGNVNDALEDFGITKQDASKLLAAAVNVLIAENQFKKTADGYVLEGKIDIGAEFKKLTTFIVSNQNKSLGEILMSATGKTQQEIETAIDQTFIDGLTVKTLIGKIETLYTTLTGKQLSIKQIVDKYQTYSGLTTTEIVNYIKKVIPEESPILAQLTVPSDGQTLYDYVIAKVGEISIDGIIQEFAEEDMTLSQAAPFMKFILFGDPEEEGSAIVLKDIIDGLLYDFEIGLTAEELIAELQKTDLAGSNVSFKLVIGEDEKIKSIETGFVLKAVQIEGNTTEVLSHVTLDLDIALSFTQPQNIVFAIPDAAR